MMSRALCVLAGIESILGDGGETLCSACCVTVMGQLCLLCDSDGVSSACCVTVMGQLCLLCDSDGSALPAV